MKTIFTKSIKLRITGLLFIVLSITSVFAQTNGSIRGTVSDGETKGYLIGATVILKGTKYHAVTGSDGGYVIPDVKPGTYTLTISYIGFNDYSSEVTVSNDGSTVSHAVEMKPMFETLGEVTVKGNRFGTSKALNEQKESANIVNIVSEEQIQSFPDLNTAEVLQRVSGVTIQKSGGEGRFVAMRGTAPNMTNVTINGAQVAFSNGEKRVVELDVVSADQLSGIEVTKVITPEMDANSIGGTVNLKTRSAFDRGTMRLDARIQGGKQSVSDGGNFQASTNYSDVYGENKNIGFSMGANFQRTNRESHSNQHKWGDRDDVDDNVIPMALRDTEVQYSKNQRDRLGINGQLDFRINENNRFYINGMYNYRWDDQDRQITRVRFDKGDYISGNEVEGVRFVKSLNDRVEEQKLTSFNLGGEHQLGKLKLDYQWSSSSAFTKKPDGQLRPEFQMKKVDVMMDNLDTKTPDWIVTNGVDTHNGDNYEYDGLDYKGENTNGKVNNYSVNLDMPLLLGSNTGNIKFGSKYRTIDKDRGDDRISYDWEGDDLFLSQFETGNIIALENGYDIGKRFNRDLFRNFFNENQDPDNGFNPTERLDVILGEAYKAKENTFAAYAMAKQTYGKLLVIAGLRYEKTNLDYTASQLVLDNKDFISNELVNTKRSYDFIFPNLQFRFKASEDTNIRLAYSEGIAPPNFYNAMPYSTTNIDDEEINRGNPDLNPTQSNNIDLLGEHFFKGIGIISGGIFYKRMTEFTFASKHEQQGGEYDGYDVFEYLNGDGADLFGIELTWQQQFTFLPGFWSGFGIYTNYTYTDASNINLGTDTERVEIDALPEQMQQVGNAALTYESKRITARIAMNYSGKWIDEVGGIADEDEWRDAATTIDFSAGYKLGHGLNIFVEYNNITNEVRYTYTGVSTRSREYVINGSIFNAGIRWSLN